MLFMIYSFQVRTLWVPFRYGKWPKNDDDIPFGPFKNHEFIPFSYVHITIKMTIYRSFKMVTLREKILATPPGYNSSTCYISYDQLVSPDHTTKCHSSGPMYCGWLRNPASPKGWFFNPKMGSTTY